MVHVATKVEARTKQRKHYNKSKQRVQCEKRESERASDKCHKRMEMECNCYRSLCLNLKNEKTESIASFSIQLHLYTVWFNSRRISLPSIYFISFHFIPFDFPNDEKSASSPNTFSAAHFQHSEIVISIIWWHPIANCLKFSLGRWIFRMKCPIRLKLVWFIFKCRI